jgi:CHRD domain
MRKRGVLAALGVATVALGVTAYALAGGPGFNKLSESLIGYQEVPSVSTAGHATFTADVAQDGESIDWALTYGGMEGQVQQSHIHFGQRGVNGGITVFLCTNLGNGPPNTDGAQACPQSGTVDGTIRASDVSPNIPATAAARTQGINTGEFAEFARAVEAGKTYVNLHTTLWPGGEIRAQINEAPSQN